MAAARVKQKAEAKAAKEAAKVATEEAAKKLFTDTVTKLEAFTKGEIKPTPKQVKDMGAVLSQLSGAQLQEIKKKFGVKASGVKAELANKIAAALVAKPGTGAALKAKITATLGKKPPVPESPAPVPKADLKPVPKAEYVADGQPVGERIKQHKRGAVLAENITALHTQREAERERSKQIIRDFPEREKAVKDSPRWYTSKKKMAAWEDLKKEEEAAKDSLAGIDEKYRKQAHALLVADNAAPVFWNAKVEGQINKYQQKAHSEGLDFLTSVVSHGHAGPLPKTSPVTKAIPAGQSQRDYHNGMDDSINLSVNTTVPTMVHEMGHWMEDNVPGSLASVQEFLRHRVGNEPYTNLRDKFGHFDSAEFGRKDNFDRALSEYQAYYVGKDYISGNTEVLSMGVELLHKDPVGFAAKDPEYFSFIVGLCDGSLRNHNRSGKAPDTEAITI